MQYFGVHKIFSKHEPKIYYLLNRLIIFKTHTTITEQPLPAPAVDFLLDNQLDEWPSDDQEPLQPDQLVGYGQPPVLDVEEATPEDDGKSNQQPP